MIGFVLVVVGGLAIGIPVGSAILLEEQYNRLPPKRKRIVVGIWSSLVTAGIGAFVLGLIILGEG